MDRPTSRTDPLGRTEHYAYDGNGNVSSFTDRKGQVTTFDYDSLDRPTFAGFGTTGPPGSETYESTVAYAYDGGDRLTQAIDSQAGTITDTYDDLDRLTQETTPEGSLSYSYDAADRRQTMSVAGEPQVAYGYDAADRLTQITKGSASVALAYDNADRRTQLTLPNGVATEYGYDAASNLTDLTYAHGQSALGELQYRYDAAGSRTDLFGSFARTGLPNAASSASYDDANELTAWAGQALSYDEDGNLISDGQSTYTWNARGELASISGATTASFLYDAFGRRVRKTIAGQPTRFLYDADNVIQELTGAGTPSANLVTGPDVDEYFQRTDANGTRNFLADALGSTLALTDPAGALTTEYAYEPFGEATATGAPDANSFQYTGRETDGALAYYRARYYSPALHRFLSEDPIGFAGGDTNLYAYVADSPTNLVDPSGLTALSTTARRCARAHRHALAFPEIDGMPELTGTSGQDECADTAPRYWREDGKAVEVVEAIAHSWEAYEVTAGAVVVGGLCFTFSGLSGGAAALVCGPPTAAGAVAAWLSLKAAIISWQRVAGRK